MSDQQTQTTQSRPAPAGVYTLQPLLTPAELANLCKLDTVKTHHDDDGGHARHSKDLRLPGVAESLWRVIKDLDLGQYKPWAIDRQMKLYRLEAGSGAVPSHVDEDFPGPNGSVARHSVIVYLNAQYGGGETIIRDYTMRHARAGSALVFRHDLPHSGLKVTSGVKMVLKTDIFSMEKGKS